MLEHDNAPMICSSLAAMVSGVQTHDKAHAIRLSR
jgi:hypothetical protein